MARYIALSEETYAAFRTPTTTYLYFKLLSESITLTREDYFPETAEHWTVVDKGEGHFSHAGDFEVLIEPNQWPKLLVMFIGDSSATNVTGTAYSNIWKFGEDENFSAVTKMKPFTTYIGVDGVLSGGVDDDRQICGTVIETLTIEGTAREVLSSTVSVLGSGLENLTTALTQEDVTTGLEAAYDQPYFVFGDMVEARIGGTVIAGGVTEDTGTNVLASATGTSIESLSLTLKRSYDTEYYMLGQRYWHKPILSGMAEVTGTMELSWQDQLEYERYLGSAAATADQSSFALQFRWQGAGDADTGAPVVPYELEIIIPSVYYTGSSIPVSARDRIKQTVDFKGIYNTTLNCAAWIEVVNKNNGYETLVNVAV